MLEFGVLEFGGHSKKKKSVCACVCLRFTHVRLFKEQMMMRQTRLEAIENEKESHKEREQRETTQCDPRVKNTENTACTCWL